MLLDIVKQIVAKSGEQILFDSKRINAFFSDLAKDEPKPQKQAFIECLEHKTVKILKDVAEEERANCKEAIAQRLHTEEGRDIDLYRKAIDIICEVLFGRVPEPVAKKYAKEPEPIVKKYTNEPKIDFETCPHCRTAYANNNNPNTCPHCGKQLEFDCWNCGNKTKKTNCSSCGAAKDDETRFESIVKRIESLRTQKEIPFTDIETELNNLKKLLPDYKKIAKSKLAQKIVEYEQLIYVVKFEAIGGGTLTAKVGSTAIYSGTTVAPGTDIRFEAKPRFGHRVDTWRKAKKEFWWSDKEHQYEVSNNRYKSYISGSEPMFVTVHFKIILYYILLGMFVCGLGTAILANLLYQPLGLWALIIVSIIAPTVTTIGAIMYDKNFYGMLICVTVGLLVLWAPGFVYLKKANTHFDSGNYTFAIKDYNRSMIFFPFIGWDVYNKRGIAYYNEHDYDKAILDYTKAIQLMPDTVAMNSNRAMTYNNRGIAYSSKMDNDRAIADYTEAIRLKPDFTVAYYYRGRAYYYKGNYNLAIADYEATLRLDPKHELAKNNLEIIRRMRHGK